jgi:hypothetical protein
MLYDPAYSGVNNMEMSKMSNDDVKQPAVNETEPQTVNETAPPEAVKEMPPEVDNVALLLADVTPKGFTIRDIVGKGDIWVRRIGGVPGEVAAMRQHPDGRWETVEVITAQARLNELVALRRR